MSAFHSNVVSIQAGMTGCAIPIGVTVSAIQDAWGACIDAPDALPAGSTQQRVSAYTGEVRAYATTYRREGSA